MKIRYQTWRRFTRVGGFLALPVVLFLFFRPDFGAWTHTLMIFAYIFMISLGVSGALLAILIRVGIVQWTYSDADKQSMSYKMSQTAAEMERIDKRGYSDSCCEGLGVKPPPQKGADDKPAA